jgi:hypothetical protein
MLVLLGTKQPLYMTIQEGKIGRRRFIRGLTLQSDNPEESYLNHTATEQALLTK